MATLIQQRPNKQAPLHPFVCAGIKMQYADFQNYNFHERGCIMPFFKNKKHIGTYPFPFPIASSANTRHSASLVTLSTINQRSSIHPSACRLPSVPTAMQASFRYTTNIT
jgi:hypothetical protein